MNRAEKLTPYQRSLIDFSTRDEVVKLRLIVEDATEPIYPSYLLEKLNRILYHQPIALDPGKQRRFNNLKGEPIDEEGP